MADSILVKRHYNKIVEVGTIPTLKDFEGIIHNLQGIDLDAIAYFLNTVKEDGENGILHKTAKKIEGAASSLGNLPEHIYVGYLPTGSFNAQVIKTIDGPLVLINTGANFLLLEIIKLFVLSTFAIVDSAKDASDTEIRNAIGMTESEVSEQLARLIFTYVTHGDASSSRRLPMLKDDLLAVSGILSTATSEFLIAHEYGHIICNHLKEFEPLNALNSDKLSKLEFNHKSLEQEVEADIKALQICTTLTFIELGGNINLPEKMIKLQLRFAAPTIFFSISDLIEEAFKGLIGKRGYLIIGDHPPSPMRQQYCNEYLSNISSKKSLEIAHVFESWISHYKDSVIDFVRYLVLH